MSDSTDEQASVDEPNAASVAEPANEPSQAVPRDYHLTVVGIGASAGGLEVLKELISGLPETSNAVFLVAMHLSPSHESQLVDILSHRSKLPIRAAKSGEKLAPGTVYVTPPNANLTIRGEKIELQPAATGPYPKPSVDVLFRSMARECGEHAVGVIVSGTGSDGAVGVREIKQAGGVNIVQDPESATYDGMPLAAIGTGCVDLVIEAERLADIITSVISAPLVDNEKKPEPTEEDKLKKVVSRLKEVEGVDFGYIKPTTMLRRISRRSALHADQNLETYIERLDQDADEVRTLARSVLISVTSFFRDPKAFDELSNHMKALMRRKSSDGTLRIWVAACATGEEAYSIAMLYFAIADEMADPPALTIFASDMDAAAIEKARLGFYSQDVVANLPPAHLERFFTHTGDLYQVRSRVRQSIVFSVQNLMNDPPFSRIDLISCRNFLIYLRAPHQQSTLELFHYALAPDGVLFLGSTETTSLSKGLFTELCNEHRIFKRRELDPDYRARVRGRLEQPFRARSTAINEGRRAARETIPQNAAALIARDIAPRWLVIDEYDIVKYISDACRELVQLPSGPTVLRVHDILSSELNLDLRGMLYRARRDGNRLEGTRTYCKINGKLTALMPLILSMSPVQPDHWLIVFRISDVPKEPGENNDAAAKSSIDLEYVKDMENRLEMMQQDMRSLSEELETSNEELQSQSEELQSSNEELQSMNEQLLTSNEELQSSNEELITVNEELRNRSDALGVETARLTTLADSIDVPTMIFDARLLLQSANPHAGKLMLSTSYAPESAIGSLPWTHSGKDIVAAAKKTLETGDPIEIDVEATDGSPVQARFHRVGESSSQIAGLVVIFTPKA